MRLSARPWCERAFKHIVNPSEHALQSLEHWRRIGLRLFTETGIFSEWKWLQRTGFTAVQHTAGTINIHAAQNDNAARDAAKCVHQLPGLCGGAEDDVDDHLRLELAQRGRIFPQVVAVASDGPHVA